MKIDLSKIKPRPVKSKLVPGSFLILEKSKIGKDFIQTINARNLHQWLEVKTDYSDWIKKRIEDGRFIENRDFIKIPQKKGLGKNNNLRSKIIEYYISLDMAKHLAMMERNDKGFEAREYFIQCEKESLRKERVVIQDNPFNLEDLGLGLLQVGPERRQAQKQVRRRWVNILQNSIGCGNIWVRRLTNEVYQILLDNPNATARNFRQHMNLPEISAEYLTRDQLEGHIQSCVSDIEYLAIGAFSLDRDIEFTEIREFVHQQAKLYHRQLLRIIQRQPAELIFHHEYNVVPMQPYRERRMQCA